MKQTAVEWLVSQLNKPGFTEVVTDEEIRQAKEMEKEQIENAYNKGQKSEWHKSMGLMGDHYYNKTFNTKER